MIVREDNCGLLLVRQTDHADLSGQFAANWGNESFDRLEPYHEMVLAAAEHDRGWLEWETNPSINSSTKRPYNFFELPVDQHAQLYSTGIKNVAELNTYSGIMVSKFGEGLYRMALEGAGDLMRSNFIEEQRSFQRSLKSIISKSPEYVKYSSEEHLSTNYSLLKFFDIFSLYFCTGEPSTRTFTSIPMGYGKRNIEISASVSKRNTVYLEPFPFSKDKMKIILTVRIIPNVEYLDDRSLWEVYYAAERMELTYTLARF